MALRVGLWIFWGFWALLAVYLSAKSLVRLIRAWFDPDFALRDQKRWLNERARHRSLDSEDPPQTMA